MTTGTVQAPFVLIGGKEDKLKGLQADLMLKAPSFYTELTEGKWFGEFSGTLLVKISDDGESLAGSPDEVFDLIELLWEYLERENQQSFMRVDKAEGRYAAAYAVQFLSGKASCALGKFVGLMKPVHPTLLGTVPNAVKLGGEWFSPR